MCFAKYFFTFFVFGSTGKHVWMDLLPMSLEHTSNLFSIRYFLLDAFFKSHFCWFPRWDLTREFEFRDFVRPRNLWLILFSSTVFFPVDRYFALPKTMIPSLRLFFPHCKFFPFFFFPRKISTTSCCLEALHYSSDNFLEFYTSCLEGFLKS